MWLKPNTSISNVPSAKADGNGLASPYSYEFSIFKITNAVCNLSIAVRFSERILKTK